MLFVGSVGRPDLGGARAAEDIWESLQRVLLPLDDSVEVYPAHGAGSACGKAMSAKSGSTIGFERRFNPAFQLRRQRAVRRLPHGGHPAQAARRSRRSSARTGAGRRWWRPSRGPYTAREAWEAVQRGDVVLDLRDPGDLRRDARGGRAQRVDRQPAVRRARGRHGPGRRAAPAAWRGPSDLDRAVQALVARGRGRDRRLPAVGHGRVAQRGVPGRDGAADHRATSSPAWLEQGRDVAVIDVREHSEWVEGHIDGAVHLPMLEAVARRAEVPADRPKAVLCAGGLRSSTVISALKRHGLQGFHNVTGGMAAWKGPAIPPCAPHRIPAQLARA